MSLKHKVLREGELIRKSNSFGLSAYNRCVECDDIISNPVCSGCLSLQMKAMLSEVDPKLVSQVVPAEIHGETSCISCNSKMGLCAHCFSKDVYEQIKEINEVAATEFLARFDYDLRVIYC